jgi:hypothetical protein
LNDIVTPGEAAAPPPHRLARELAEFLASQLTPLVLVLGYGSGRNVPALVDVGARLAVVDDDAGRASVAAARFAGEKLVSVTHAGYAEFALPGGPFAGALSTHALLHGTPERIAAAIAHTAAHLAAGAPFFLTLGTKSDPRFGAGLSGGPDTYAATSGSEAGVPHAYFDDAGVRALLRDFTIDALVESSAAETSGSWAHSAAEAETLRHWFVRARRRPAKPAD